MPTGGEVQSHPQVWPWPSSWRALGKAGWGQGVGKNRPGGQGRAPSWPEGLQHPMEPWGSFLASHFLFLQTSDPEYLCFLPAFSSFLAWTALLNDFQ